jgi:hypothetical protein
LNNQKNKEQSYINLFIMFSTSVEKWLKRCIVVLLVALILFQILLQSSEIRYYITTIGRLEGVVDQPDYRE